MEKLSGVYFARLEGWAEPIVKIGKSNNIVKRLRGLGGPGKMTLLAWVPGTERELEFHEKFRKHKVKGEYFRLEGGLSDFIQENAHVYHPELESETTPTRSMLDGLEDFSHRLPEDEFRMAALFRAGRTQAEIANEFGVTQPAVCYRLRRCEERLALLREIPEKITDGVSSVLTKSEMETVIAFWKNNSQSEVARTMNESQTGVRMKILTAISKLCRSPDPEIANCGAALKKLMANPGLLPK